MRVGRLPSSVRPSSSSRATRTLRLLSPRPSGPFQPDQIRTVSTARAVYNPVWGRTELFQPPVDDTPYIGKTVCEWQGVLKKKIGAYYVVEFANYEWAFHNHPRHEPNPGRLQRRRDRPLSGQVHLQEQAGPARRSPHPRSPLHFIAETACLAARTR